jgi:hypothetical protein
VEFIGVISLNSQAKEKNACGNSNMNVERIPQVIKSTYQQACQQKEKGENICNIDSNIYLLPKL